MVAGQNGGSVNIRQAGSPDDPGRTLHSAAATETLPSSTARCTYLNLGPDDWFFSYDCC